MRIYLFFLILVIASCKQPDTSLRTGIWRAALQTETGQEIPFNFEVQKDSAGQPVIYVMNGTERIRVDEITFQKDSFRIVMPVFDSEFRGRMENGLLTGDWIKHLADKDVLMPFKAEHGISYRFFKDPEPPAIDVSGRWSALFLSEENDTTLAIGEFMQEGHKLTGTFLTSTGDYRYLEGAVNDSNFYLSCFDGSHAFLFTGIVLNKDTITGGRFFSGRNYSENWTGIRNEQATLPDAYSLTYLKPGYEKVSFTFPDLEKKPVSLSDERFRHKVIILQIMGSWCPNCMDEAAFLSRFYREHTDEGLEIIGLSYERSPDFEKAKSNVVRFKDRFSITYPLLIAGTRDKASETLPMLNRVMGFPTTIIIDRKGKVRRIHTGFSGPGTGRHYTEFVTEFEGFISDLLQEK